MQYFLNGAKVSPAQSVVYVGNRAILSGMDTEEAMGIWKRASADDEDGEYARDMLTTFAPDLEIIAG